MIKPTTNINHIHSVLKHDDIWPNIADNEDRGSFTAPIDDNHHYLYDDGILFILHRSSSKWQIHANVVKSKRDSAKEAADEALSYGFNVLDADVIFCEIPEKYENVLRFARKFLNYDYFDNGSHYLSIGRDQWALLGE